MLLDLAAAWDGLDGRDLVREVTCQEAYHWVDGTQREWKPGGGRSERRHSPAASPLAPRCPLVVAYDFGIKQNILRRLTSHGLRVTVVPAHTPAGRGARVCSPMASF